MKNWRTWNLQKFAKVLCVIAGIIFLTNIVGPVTVEHLHPADWADLVAIAYLAYRIEALNNASAN